MSVLMGPLLPRSSTGPGESDPEDTLSPSFFLADATASEAARRLTSSVRAIKSFSRLAFSDVIFFTVSAASLSDGDVLKGRVGVKEW